MKLNLVVFWALVCIFIPAKAFASDEYWVKQARADKHIKNLTAYAEYDLRAKQSPEHRKLGTVKEQCNRLVKMLEADLGADHAKMGVLADLFQ